jgi:hypothetical protein
MSQALTAALTEWHEYYLVAGSAAAVLLGLVFLGFTIRLESLTKQRQAAWLASVSAVCFIHPLMYSLVMVAPPWWPWFPLVALALLGVFTLALTLDSFVRVRREGAPRRGRLLFSFTLPIVCATLLLIADCLVFLGVTESLYLVAGVTFALIAIGIESAWDFFVQPVDSGSGTGNTVLAKGAVAEAPTAAQNDATTEAGGCRRGAHTPRSRRTERGTPPVVTASIRDHVSS